MFDDQRIDGMVVGGNYNGKGGMRVGIQPSRECADPCDR